MVRHLRNQLETNVKMRHNDTIECVQMLSNSVSKVFKLIEIEIERCNNLSNGCAILFLIESIKVQNIEIILE